MTSLTPTLPQRPDDTPWTYALAPGHYVLALDPDTPQIPQAVAIAQLLLDHGRRGPSTLTWMQAGAN